MDSCQDFRSRPQLQTCDARMATCLHHATWCTMRAAVAQCMFLKPVNVAGTFPQHRRRIPGLSPQSCVRRLLAFFGAKLRITRSPKMRTVRSSPMHASLGRPHVGIMRHLQRATYSRLNPSPRIFSCSSLYCSIFYLCSHVLSIRPCFGCSLVSFLRRVNFLASSASCNSVSSEIALRQLLAASWK